ncbi:hypothetical protein [Streptomyces hebeiensis]
MIARLPVTTALAELVTTATGFPVGRGQKPSQDPPYYLLHSIHAQVSGAPFADRGEDSSLVYQLTAVSGPDPARPGSYGVADQAELMADRARTAILGRDPTTGRWLHDLTVPGARVIGRNLDVEAGAASDASDGIMSYALRIRLDLTS